MPETPASTVRLHILSDLHLGRDGLILPPTDADIIILAGDVGRPDHAVQWAASLGKPVLYVPGNHEYYDASIRSTLDDLQRRCAGTQITVLNQAQTVLHGVRFVGATLWTDYMVYGDGPHRDDAIAEALKFVPDYRCILDNEIGDRSGTFTPDHAQAIFQTHSTWIDSTLDQPFDGPTVVITHHAPSAQSIHPRFAGSPINVCFVSDLEHLMGEDRAVLWVHGHTHDSFDYTVKGTRVVCNPRGYVRNGITENSAFDPGFTVTLETGASG